MANRLNVINSIIKLKSCNKFCSTVIAHNVSRQYSATPPPQKSQTFIQKVYENFRDEVERNKKFKKSVKEFQEECENLEQSEALVEARRKYKAIEEETLKGTKKAKKQLKNLTNKVMNEAQNAEFMKKASKATEKASEQAHKVGQTITRKSEEFVKTQAFKTISGTAKIVRKEIDQSTFGIGSGVYRAPIQLKRRRERDLTSESKIIEANAEARSIVIHKDSKFSQSWENFKNSNAYMQKVMEWRTKIDESDHPIVRASMILKDKATRVLGGVFERTELSETLTEICKMDPSFHKEKFLLECEYFIIPNILEAMIRPDLVILEDWCYQNTFSVLAAQVKHHVQLGHTFDSQILDVNNVDLVMGKIMDQGPIVAISFQTQQITSVKNSRNEVIEGDPKKVFRMNYIWILCRDQNELDPHTAWRLLDQSAHGSEQLI